MDNVSKKVLKDMGLKISEKVLDKLEGKDLDKYNFFRTKEIGKKKYDYLRLMDTPTKKLFSMNLYEWDKKNWKFQQKQRGLQTDEFEHLYMLGEWFQAIEVDTQNKRKKEILYGTIESARSHIFIAVLEELSDKKEELYPSMYATKYGDKLFKKVGKNKKYRTLNLGEIRYGLDEEKHKILSDSLKSLESEIETEVLAILEPFSAFTFKEIRREEGAMADTFIIGGFEAAKEIKFKSLFKDFYDREQPYQILENIKNKLVKKYWKKANKS